MGLTDLFYLLIATQISGADSPLRLLRPVAEDGFTLESTAQDYHWQVSAEANQTNLLLNPTAVERSQTLPLLNPASTINEVTPACHGEVEDWLVAAEALPLPATQFRTTFLSGLASRSLGITSVDLQHTLLLGYDDYPPLSITPGAGAHYVSGPRTLDLPPRLYDAYLELQWQPWNGRRSSLLVGATPGLFGDFERIDSQTFQWSGWLIGTRQLGDHWTLLGGVAYLRQLKSNWLPMGGAVWIPNEATRVELLFPRPRVARRWRSSDSWTTWTYLAGQYGGGAWTVMDTPEQNVLLSYSDLRLLGGIESFSRRGHEWRAEFGYVFARELSVNNVMLEKPTDGLLAQCTYAF